VINLN